MYYEKWGFMLILWNLAGVPLSYCHCTIYLATTNSQKNRFRQQERGTLVSRNTFPQLPWQTVENPKTLTAADGSKILVDGWCKFMPNIKILQAPILTIV